MKNPLFIIAALFLLAYLMVGQLNRPGLFEQPVVLSQSQPPDIVMLSQRNCHYCRTARHFFSRHQLPFTEHDIDGSAQHRRMFNLLGGRGTPLLIINGQVIQGFDEHLVRQAL